MAIGHHRVVATMTLALVVVVAACAGEPTSPAATDSVPAAPAATSTEKAAAATTSRPHRWARDSEVAMVTDGGRTVSFSMIEDRCPADYEAEVVEEMQQVTVSVRATLAPDCPVDDQQDRAGTERVMTVRLVSPLDARPLIDANGGREAHVVDAEVALRPVVLPPGWESSKFLLDDESGVPVAFGPIGDINDVPAIMLQVRPVFGTRDLLAGLRSRKPEFFREIGVRGGTANAVWVQHNDPGRVILGFVEDGYSYRFVRRADVDETLFLDFIEDLARPA